MGHGEGMGGGVSVFGACGRVVHSFPLTHLNVEIGRGLFWLGPARGQRLRGQRRGCRPLLVHLVFGAAHCCHGPRRGAAALSGRACHGAAAAAAAGWKKERLGDEEVEEEEEGLEEEAKGWSFRRHPCGNDCQKVGVCCVL